MKTRLSFLFWMSLSLLWPGATTHAQTRNGAGLPGAAARNPGAPASPRGAPATSSRGSSLPSASDLQQPQNASQSDSPFAIGERFANSDDLSVDFEEGTFNWRGKTFNLADNRFLRERFERYLNSPDAQDNDMEYQAVLDKISDLLSVQDTGPQKDAEVEQAWNLLFDAAKYPQDGGASKVIANEVFNAWRVRQEKSQSDLARAELEAKRHEQEVTVAEQTLVAGSRLHQLMDLDAKATPSAPTASASGRNTSGSGNNNNNNTNNRSGAPAGNNNNNTSASIGSDGSMSGTLGLGSVIPGGDGSGSGGLPAFPNLPAPPTNAGYAYFDWAHLMETNMKIGIQEAQQMTAAARCVLQFQTMIVTFLFERRFQHSLIAGEFYRNIFKGSAQEVTAAKSEMQQFMNLKLNDIAPTVESLELVSRQAMDDTKSGMKAVETSYDAGERWAALSHMQMTYVLGEFQPSVQDFDSAKRKVLGTIYHNARDLKKLLDNHDFAEADKTVDKIVADAPDFEFAADVRSKVRTGEQSSNLALLSAQQSMLTGNNEQARQDLETAVNIWPLNPAIKDFSVDLRNRLGVTGAMVPQFDDLLQRRDYRQIYDHGSEYGMALLQDPARAAKLRDIMQRLGKVDMLVSSSLELVKQNNGYAAWELLSTAADLEPNDPVLNRTQVQVAPRVADFVKALNLAQTAEKSGQYAAALNYYLAAKEIYPASQLCRQGIESNSKLLMAKMNPGGQTAKALSAEQAAAKAAAGPTAPVPATAVPASDLPTAGAADANGAAPAPATSASLY